MGIKVLIVDDSATARAVLTQVLTSDPNISTDTAPDAYVARDKIVKYKPDVICLDVEMPRMDGITFLRKIMKYMPTPVIMVSSLTTKGAQTTLDALEAGAVDFVPKMHSNLYEEKDQIKKELLEKIRIAAKAKNFAPREVPIQKKSLSYKYNTLTTTQKIVAIGSSTGGTDALKQILTKLPANTPGIIITQHMPEKFTSIFANRLNSICDVEIKEASNGDVVSMGKVLIAPGDKHMVLRRSGTRYYVEIGTGKKVSGHRPSVDVMFNSVAKSAGNNAIGVILTGMGGDGAKGLKNMKDAGSMTIGQDEKSCVVYGMPKVAFDLGAVTKQESIDNMAERILQELQSISL